MGGRAGKRGQQVEAVAEAFLLEPLAPFPGTAVHDRVADYGLEILSTNWDDYHANRAVCTPAGLDPAVLDAQAEKWEQRLHLYLEDIRRKMDRGAASPEEEAQILNMERTVIIYELMMGDVLRQTNLNTNKAASEEDQLGELARQAAAKLPAFTPAQVTDALQEAQRREGLRRVGTNGQRHWEWVDYL